MNPIERLVADVERAWYDADSWTRGRDAVFAVARTFAKQWEAVEKVASFPANATGPPNRVWREGWPEPAEEGIRLITILAPRKVPTLLEAAEAVLDSYAHNGDVLAMPMHELAAAIEKERAR